MRHSLHSHIIYLENKIQTLRDRLTGSRLTTDERQSMESQIYHAELALEHYRQAYALELGISTPEPPTGPGTKSDGENGNRSNSSSEKKKKDGLAGIAARARKKSRTAVSPDPARYRRQCISRNRSGLAKAPADRTFLPMPPARKGA
jgi:hypothetical protein